MKAALSKFLTPQFLGISDDEGSLMMVDHNNNLKEYREWSDDPFMSVGQTNGGYEYGVNCLMHALTH